MLWTNFQNKVFLHKMAFSAINVIFPGSKLNLFSCAWGRGGDPLPHKKNQTHYAFMSHFDQSTNEKRKYNP